MEKFKRTFGFIFNHPLGKRHPLRAIFKFIAWQIQLKVTSKPFIIKNFIAGVKFNARKGLTGITGNIYTGLHEFNDMCFLLHLLKEEDTFFDIGSNVGSYTLLASGVCKSTSITFEPILSTFNILTDNISLNNLQDKVTLVNAGVGDTNENLIFSINEDTTNHVITTGQQNRDTIEVPVIIIDETTYNIPLLIKIDVEGFEARVLNGMQKLLQNPGLKALIVELSNCTQYGYNDDFTHQLLTKNGFTSYGYDPFTRELTPAETPGITNTIYCRDVDFIKTRLKTAHAFTIMGETI